MQMIYEPKGKAREYAELALNLFNGCTNGCKYCYVPDMPVCKSKGITAEQFHAGVTLRAPWDVMERQIHKDCEKLAASGDTREILLSFTSDPFPHEAVRMYTEYALRIIFEHGLRATVLTKNPSYVLRLWALVSVPLDRFRVGTTAVFWHSDYVRKWEGKASSVDSRLYALRELKKAGVRTWLSVEPVISPYEALTVIEKFKPVVDEFKIGKINYYPELEKLVNWSEFVKQVKVLLKGHNYKLKESLRRYDCD